MNVEFASAQLRNLCSTGRELAKRFGSDGGRTVMRRLQQLEAAPTLGAMRDLPGHCHELTAERAGQLAVRAAGGHRLVFRPRDPAPLTPDGSLDWDQVAAVIVLDIVDYH